MKKFEKKYGHNINANNLENLISKTTCDLQGAKDQFERVEKEVATGLGKQQLIMKEMTGFDITGIV